MSRRPILLLDVMGTLVYEPFYVEVPEFFGMTLEELIDAKHPTAWAEYETGSIDEAALEAKFFRDRRAYDHAGMKACMTAAYRWIDGMEELTEDLRAAAVEMHALSNYSEWYKLIEGKLALGRFLRWTFVSCLTGVRKPDPEAYLGAARKLGVSPADCLFVDDREANCEAARETGMPAIRFEDADQIRERLTGLGLLP